MALKICLAGCTGWVGKELAPAIQADPGLELVAAVSRRAAGRDLAEVVPGARPGLMVSAGVEEALEQAAPEVYIDYTLPPDCLGHARAALNRHIPVVMGATGIAAGQFAELHAQALKAGVGIISANFSLTASLLQHFAVQAARFLPTWEIIDYADPQKLDAPSGTGRELAEQMAAVKRPAPARDIAELHGPKEARGAELGGARLHSVRQPGFGLTVDVVFGLEHERLVLHHMAGTSARPYVAGTLLAAKRINEVKGLMRGLHKLLFQENGGLE